MGFPEDTGSAPAGGAPPDLAGAAQRAPDLLASGLVGAATVRALRDTGTTVGDDPVVELDLDVVVAGAPPYRVAHRQAISRLAVAGFQPGSTVPVRVGPDDPYALIVA